MPTLRSFQSTPVIADGRIWMQLTGPLMVAAFQSTPVIADGRIRAVTDDELRGFACFNPRPSLLTGESFYPNWAQRRRRWFQSTPVIADGRIDVGALEDRLQLVVSIHARHC